MSVELVEEVTEQRERKLRGILVLAGCLLGIFLSEVLLRIVIPDPSGNFIHRPRLIRTFHPLPEVMVGVEGVSEFRVNSLGVRGTEPPEEGIRILTLGGSTTECLYLDQAESWPHLLGNHLNEKKTGGPVWVGNAGKTGVSSREHRLQVPILLKDIPDIDTLILLVGVNDVLLRLALDDQYDPDFVVKPGSREFLMSRAFDIVRSPTEQSHIPFFPRKFFGLGIRFAGNLIGIDQNPESIHLVEDESGKMYLSRREYRRNRIGTRETLPDLSTGLREYEKNLTDCLEAAREKEVRLIWVSQPVLWEEGLAEEYENLLWTGGVRSISGQDLEYYSTGALSRAISMYNRKLEDLAISADIPFLDLASLLPKDTTVFYDDCHFNEEGSKKVAALIGDFLIELGWEKPND
jgi:lysophospholipase L1-like esterase